MLVVQTSPFGVQQWSVKQGGSPTPTANAPLGQNSFKQGFVTHFDSQANQPQPVARILFHLDTHPCKSSPFESDLKMKAEVSRLLVLLLGRVKATDLLGYALIVTA